MFEKEYADVNTVGFDEPVPWKKKDYSYIEYDDTVSESGTDTVTETGSETETESESETESETETEQKIPIVYRKSKPKKEYKCILQEETNYIIDEK
jgi:hypothetical protein